MLKTLGIVQACFGSPRFRCIVHRKLGGRSVLQWVVRRVTDCMRLDGVIVVARDAAEHRFIRELVPMDVPVFVGSQPDALGRFSRALEEYPAEAVVRVRGDNPFIDPGLIDRLITTAEDHPSCDYVSYCSRDGRPAILSPVGIYAEWFHTAALRRAARASKSRGDREHVTRYIYSHPEKFNLRLIPAPPQIDRDDVRLTVDIEEDWEHAVVIFEALGPEALDWQRIADLLDHQPALRRRMAALNRTCSKGSAPPRKTFRKDSTSRWTQAAIGHPVSPSPTSPATPGGGGYVRRPYPATARWDIEDAPPMERTAAGENPRRAVRHGQRALRRHRLAAVGAPVALSPWAAYQLPLLLPRLGSGLPGRRSPRAARIPRGVRGVSALSRTHPQPDRRGRGRLPGRRHQLEDSTQPLPGVKSTLERLHQSELTLGVLSNSEHPGSVLRQRLGRFGVGELVTTVVSSIDLKRTMPDPACYLTAVKAMELPAELVAFVGRDTAELAGAGAVGMPTIALHFDTDAQADVYLARFDELLEAVGPPPPLAAAG